MEYTEASGAETPAQVPKKVMCGLVLSCISIFPFLCKSIAQIVAGAASVAATNAASVLVALIRQHTSNTHNNLSRQIIWVANAFNNMQSPPCSNSALGLLILFMEESSIKMNPYVLVLPLRARSFFSRPVPHAGKGYCGHPLVEDQSGPTGFRLSFWSSS